MVEDIVIDKNKGKKKESSQKSSQNDSSVSSLAVLVLIRSVYF